LSGLDSRIQNRQYNRASFAKRRLLKAIIILPLTERKRNLVKSSKEWKRDSKSRPPKTASARMREGTFNNNPRTEIPSFQTETVRESQSLVSLFLQEKRFLAPKSPVPSASTVETTSLSMMIITTKENDS
jgi:hypothetical protein